MDAWKPAYVDSGAPAHMVMEDPVLSINRDPGSGSAGTVVERLTDGRARKRLKLCCLRDRMVKLERVLQVPKIGQIMALVAALSNERHTLQFSKTSCVVKMQRNILGVSRPTSKMYAVDFKNVGGQHTLAAEGKEVSVLNVWGNRLPTLTVEPSSGCRTGMLSAIWTCVSALF